ncbi:MAG: ATP-binding cassette domain-containing protein [Clostridia bacterium]|nr:ATP-binding cassette domain-containing protein [Clostridia bacterium]
MKLQYSLPSALETAVRQIIGDEEVLYCLPYDIEGDVYIEDGYLIVTRTKILRGRGDTVIGWKSLAELSDFTAEKLYGSAGLFAKENGNTVLICRFVSGKHLARYSVIARACEELAKDAAAPIAVNDEPEKFCPVCGRRYLKGTHYCPNCRKKSEIYKKLWDMTRGMRLILLFPVFATAVALILRFVLPAIQKVAINDYIYPADGTARGTMTGFLVVIAAIVTLDIVQRALSVLQGRISAISGNKFTLRLREQLFEKLHALSMSSITKKTTGDMMGRINEDVSTVQNFITNLLPSYLSQILSFVIALVILIAINPLMCLFVFVPLPIAIYAVLRFWKYMRLRWRRRWTLRRRVNEHLHDALTGIRVIKNYGNEAHAIRQFSEKVDLQADQDERTDKVFSTFFPIIGFVLRLGNYLILLYGNILLFGGNMSVGELNQFNSYSSILYEPLMQINQIPQNITEFMTSFSKILEVLEEEPEISDTDTPRDVKLCGNISVRDVTFGYDSYNPVLEHVDLEVKSGEMIGIVGHSGSGKTTLINLIMRLYEAGQGQILMDGVDIREISQTALRSQIGVVLQETLLFSGSVRDNIRYAKPDATNAEIIRAAKMANAHDFIMALPQGYNTIVGEKGYSLSGGERQRVAIARALIHDPAILILDEATASLDTETEKLIQDALSNLTENRTTIAIAHRLSTLRGADKLLVLDHGRVAEFGTHKELLDRRGIYYKLVMAQTEAAIAKG